VLPSEHKSPCEHHDDARQQDRPPIWGADGPDGAASPENAWSAFAESYRAGFESVNMKHGQEIVCGPWILRAGVTVRTHTFCLTIKAAAPRIALRVIDDAIQAHSDMGVTSDAGLARMDAHLDAKRPGGLQA
jgi:hypothetical protein